MRNTGLRNPRRNALIALAITLAGASAIAIGIWIMEREGRETDLSATLIALGILASILGPFFLYNFLWGMQIFRRIARGEGVIASWSVPPDELDLFRRENAKRNAHGPDYVSDYRPPAISPPGGLKIAFVADGVMMGDLYFGLSTTGPYRFDAVQLVEREPLALEFRTRHTIARNVTVTTIRTETALWRVPVSRGAMDEAHRALDHFERVLRREVIVKPHFWTTRIRIGLWGAAIFGLVAAAGYVWAENTTGPIEVPLVMMVGGTIFALGGLILASIAALLHRSQHGLR